MSVSPRPIPLLILSALCVLLSGCAGAVRFNRVEVAKVPNPQGVRILGLTTVEGKEVAFDLLAAAHYANHGVEGLVNHAPVRYSMESIQRLWIVQRTISRGKTVALVAGILGTGSVAGFLVNRSFKSNHPVLQPAGPPCRGCGGGSMSCPFIYSWDGSQYVFDAEVFGGSLTRGMEQDDYWRLDHLRPGEGVYRLQLTNELDETDSINTLQLWTVDHAPDMQVATDESGKLYSIADPRPPLTARDETGADLLLWLAATDRKIWEPLPVAAPDGSVRHEIVMTFAKPEGAQTVKLLAGASTSAWGSEMVKTLLALHGNALDSRLSSLDHYPADVANVVDWATREDLFRLRVWVEEPGGWQVRGVIPWSALRLNEQRVIPLDISHAAGSVLRIRVLPPAGFWAFNSFAVDYSDPEPLHVTRLPIASAVSSAGVDIAPQLAAVDDAYFTTRQGDSADITFAAPPLPEGMARSLILHSRGFYRLNLPATGAPDTEALRRIFTEPDSFARLAIKLYSESGAGLQTANRLTIGSAERSSPQQAAGIEH
jgi:hypothetical protein